MKVGGRFEPERHAENRPLAEPVADGVRRIAFEQAQMLANDLAQRHVRDPPAVRETASDPPQRLGRPGAEPRPELPEQRRLSNPRIAHDGHEPRMGVFDNPGVRPLQRVELLPAADEGVM